MGITTTFTERIKRIFQVAFPLIIQGLVYQLQSLTDKAFLGNVDTRYVSAAGAAQMPYLATMDSLVAVSTGLIIIVSKLYGAGKKEKISAYVKSMAIYHTIVTTAVFVLWFCFTPAILDFFQIDHEIIRYSISYVRICILYMPLIGIDCALQAMLQGMGETKPIMYAGILKVGLNILISWLLIFGKLGLPALHVAGAAIGTLIANLLSFLFIFIYCVIYKRNTYHLHRFSDEKIQGKLYREIVRLGVPVGLEYLLWNGSNLILIRFINSFSYQDMAIYTLTFGFQCIIYVIFSGTSKATLSLIGQSIGAGEHKQANRFFYTTILINFVIVGIAAVCFTAFPKQLLRIFSNDHELISQAAFFLICIGFIMIPQSVNVICGNAIRANDDTKWMLFSQIFGSTFVISISYFLIKGLHMQMLAIYITLFLDETLRGTINFFYYQRKYSKI
jgi:putative MATE family efflux protein